MLVQFTLENWLSFRERETLSMVAGRERQHGDRLARIDTYRTRMLPVTALFGGNASGKTNLVQGLSFARWMITEGPKPDARIPRIPYLLDDCSKHGPTCFAFEILVDEQLFEYSFSCDDRSVLAEKLVHIRSASEVILFDRVGQMITWHSTTKSRTFLDFVFRGTRANQLFLANSISLNVDAFRPVYDWFRDSLVLFSPDRAAIPVEPFFEDTHPLHEQMCSILNQLDFGIARIESRKIHLDNIPMSDDIKTKMIGELKDDDSFLINGEFTIGLDGEDIVAKQLATYHWDSSGDEVRFAISQEADGTKRVIDLLPAFLDLAMAGSRRVYVIDEIDRSLHSVLLWRLIEAFLSGVGKDTRAQLIFTTHDLMLMDQLLFRRDEMWFTERDRDGVSTLVSFSEFKDARHDTDMRRVYLEGRTGGLPRILIDRGGLLR